MNRPPKTLALSATQLMSAPSFAELLLRIGDRPGLVALDSAGGEPGDWSWIAWEPEVLALPMPNDLRELAAYMEQAPTLLSANIPGPFQGGFLGALAYDSGVPGEAQTLPMDPWNWPGLVGGFYGRFFVFDHRKSRVFLVLPTGSSREPYEELARAAVAGQGDQELSFLCTNLHRKVTCAAHRARIEQARREIAAGEYYQANLAHVLLGETIGDPLALYMELRRVNPAPYMAYLRFPEGALLSASPELLVEVQGRELLARPIKGTAARDADALRDRELAAGLLASEKDRAELAMIVDLLRNDLGRVATVGSVQVHQFPELRSYPGVHHLMADVRAELAAGQSAVDVLHSVFPGGSITGAPKLRAMEAIGELEGEGRGFFTGSAGFLDVAGNACFNILIRTLQWRPAPAAGAEHGEVRFHVGGGITWSSNAQDEDNETLVKGANLARALGHQLEVEPQRQ